MVTITEKMVEAAKRKAPKFWRETAQFEKHMIAALEAALAAQEQPAPVVPSGWQLVPIEPTDDMMLDAEETVSALMSFAAKNKSPSYRVWKAMLAAAPQPPSQPDDGKCPRPCNGRPDDFSMRACVEAGECGCIAFQQPDVRREVIEEAETYAERLAVSLHEKHYADVTEWRPLSGDLIGLLTQIDNMSANLERRALDGGK